MYGDAYEEVPVFVEDMTVLVGGDGLVTVQCPFGWIVEAIMPEWRVVTVKEYGKGGNNAIGR